MLKQAFKQIEAMGVETVQPLETIVIAPFLTEWDPSVTFSTPRDWNSSRFSLMILWKCSKIFHTDSYLEIAWNWWSICRDERTEDLARARTGKIVGFLGFEYTCQVSLALSPV